jgi:hypothetical protein
MLTLRIRAGVYLVAFAACAGASTAANAWTLLLKGWPVMGSLAVGLLGTGFFTVVGHLLFEHLAASERKIRLALFVLVFGLCVWGALEFSSARSMMLAHRAAQEQSESPHSYVDDSNEQTPTTDPANTDTNSEAAINSRFGDAVLKFALAADLMVGMLLALLFEILSDPDYTAWRKLKKLNRVIRAQEKRRMHLLMLPMVARTLCLAGILRAKAKLKKRPPAYHRKIAALLIAVLCLTFWVAPARAQSFDRAEGILFDASGTVGRHANNDLFREYLVGVKRLLITEPPKSRVWVSVITTDSFGSTQPLVKGWTPESRGVFTDDLNRARQELASNFEAKSSGLHAVAAGTDIFGGLWQLKTLLDTVPTQDKEIWILSDMMNETTSFNMPALLTLGPTRMLQQVRANNLLVPLKGYRVHVGGVSAIGLTPEEWNTVKEFWTMYFRAAGAELAGYSPECLVSRTD